LPEKFASAPDVISIRVVKGPSLVRAHVGLGLCLLEKLRGEKRIFMAGLL
jgi:hypothetical protein